MIKIINPRNALIAFEILGVRVSGFLRRTCALICSLAILNASLQPVYASRTTVFDDLTLGEKAAWAARDPNGCGQELCQDPEVRRLVRQMTAPEALERKRPAQPVVALKGLVQRKPQGGGTPRGTNRDRPSHSIDSDDALALSSGVISSEVSRSSDRAAKKASPRHKGGKSSGKVRDRKKKKVRSVGEDSHDSGHSDRDRISTRGASLDHPIEVDEEIDSYCTRCFNVAEESCFWFSNFHDRASDRLLLYTINFIFFFNAIFTYFIPFISHATPYPDIVEGGLSLGAAGLQVTGGLLMKHRDHRLNCRAEDEEKDKMRAKESRNRISNRLTDGAAGKFATETSVPNEEPRKPSSFPASAIGRDISLAGSGLIDFTAGLLSFAGSSSELKTSLFILSTVLQSLGLYLKRIEGNRRDREREERLKKIREYREISGGIRFGDDMV